MVQAGYTGLVEVLVIALCVMWLLNSYRKSQILKKVDNQLEKKESSHQNPISKTSTGKTVIDAEDIDFEEVD